MLIFSINYKNIVKTMALISLLLTEDGPITVTIHCFSDLGLDVIDTLENAPDGWYKMVLFGYIHPNVQTCDHAAQLLLNFFLIK